MKCYSWAETLEEEKIGQLVLDSLFGLEYIVVPATDVHQRRQKIDRFLINRKDGREQFCVDYKTDRAAAKFSNLALEHVSVLRDGQVEARGWIHTTIADWIVSYVPGFDTAFVLEVTLLRERWRDIQELFPLKSTSTWNEGEFWVTQFYPVPISWLRKNYLIRKEKRAIGAQGRLKL